MDCPLIQQEVMPTVCEGAACMYRSGQGKCLYEIRDTDEFARAKGVKPSDVDRDIARAETRIQAGLTLFEFLNSVTVFVPAPPGAPDFRSEIHHHMNISHEALFALADEDTWLSFRNLHGTELRHAQVLLLTEAQLEQLQQFH